MPEVQILYLHDHTGSKKIQYTVNIETATTTVPVELTVDSGSTVSILPKCLFDKHFKHVNLLPPTVKLVTYSRAPIPVIGCQPVTVSWNDATCQTFLFIVESGTALLGMDLINCLSLCFKGTAVQPAPSMTSAPVMTTAPLPTSTLGCAKGFVHKVKVS